MQEQTTIPGTTTGTATAATKRQKLDANNNNNDEDSAVLKDRLDAIDKKLGRTTKILQGVISKK